MPRAVLGAVVAAVLALASPVQAQTSDRLAVETLDVGDRLYVVTGGGGTALVLASDLGVVLVDTKAPGFSAELQAVVGAVTDQPVTTIVNSHAHLDHIGGNPAFPGVRDVVAHADARDVMRGMDAFAEAEAGVPTRSYTDGTTLLEGVDRMELRHFGSGHTGGDTVVVFPAKGVAYLGDLFPGKRAPVVDLTAGGSALAWPDTLARVVDEVEGVSRVVAGHTPGRSRIWWPWTDVEEYATFTLELVETITAAFRAGRSADDAVTGLELASRYPDYDLDGVQAFVDAAYEELAR